MTKLGDISEKYARLIHSAVAHYWKMRTAQIDKQRLKGKSDQGTRGAVTGGAQMDGFIELLFNVATLVGIPSNCIFRKRNLELPGFFRPTKEWDIVVVKDGALLAAIEAKSQAGPSFGNNFNNRTEEAMGSALDLWTAYREHVFPANPQPFVGYLFMLEECDASMKPVRVKEPHFTVLPEFVGASYIRRYELFCRKLVLERHYSAAAFLTSSKEKGVKGRYSSPAEDLAVELFVHVYANHLQAFV